jgi:two-component system CheB/CheR fusion protein
LGNTGLRFERYASKIDRILPRNAHCHHTVFIDFGRPVQDLEFSYRPIELRGHLESLGRERRAIDIAGVRSSGADQSPKLYDVRMTPLLTDGVLMGTSVIYIDVTDRHDLEQQLTDSKRELGQAYEELQSTVEELETTNEELQSTNEELETTNEELQSTNEELETMNEELQSSNEELETMNDELRHRTYELNDMNSFLETILSTIGLAVAVIDREQRVQIWNGRARELWGLSAEEVEDKHLFGLDIGLPIEQLKPVLHGAGSDSGGRQEVVLEATNRRGRQFMCRVTVLPLAPSGEDGAGAAIVMMEPADG